MTFAQDYTSNISMLDSELRLKDSFDLVGRDLKIDKHNAKLYFVDGFCKDEIMVKIMSYFLKAEEKDFKNLKTAREFANKYVPYVETDVTANVSDFIKSVLSGGIGLIVEGYNEAIIIDARTYPVRSVGEPDNDKVLRGPHDGFVETLVFNTALLRRRIRDTALTMEIHSVGKTSQTDVVICYMKGKVNEKMLDVLRKKLDSVNVNSLTMSQQSLIDCLVPKQRLNPFPKVRYTERPDAAAASILEGSMVLMTDNSPAAMIIPTGIFDFLQDTNDYYMSPVIGSYMRIIRMAIFAMTMLLVPVWLLFVQNPEYIPAWLSFIRIEEPNTVPIVAQLFIVEVVIDAMRLASINTPQSLSSSFGVIGALVLGEFAVSAGWFVSEVVLYMAFVALTNFTQPSYELGYAFKLFRMMLIGLIALFNLWGFIAGLVLIIIEIAVTKTVTGQSYLYPLIPFNGTALLSLLLRKPLNNKN
ncbi:MAG: spore germination protein, partial [Clostridia bacterium]|nr:spore germination protein [Clostridia bacterium]